jgi:hypothetical protein
MLLNNLKCQISNLKFSLRQLVISSATLRIELISKPFCKELFHRYSEGVADLYEAAIPEVLSSFVSSELRAGDVVIEGEVFVVGIASLDAKEADAFA